MRLPTFRRAAGTENLGIEILPESKGRDAPVEKSDPYQAVPGPPFAA
jgi:hypothetical protein